MMGFGMGFMWLGGLVSLTVLVLVIYLIVRLAGGLNRPSNYSTLESQYENKNRALEMLAERYAKGEIGDEEYRQRKAELTRYYR